MIRKIIQIDEEACIGCGRCVRACHESAIGMVNRKARLLRDDYCDALGDCLPACPVDAIHFVEREAEAFDPEAVAEHKAAQAERRAERREDREEGYNGEGRGRHGRGGYGGGHHGHHHDGTYGGHHGHGHYHGDRDGDFGGSRGSHGRHGHGAPLDADAALVEGELLWDAAVDDVAGGEVEEVAPSELAQWPCQIKLMPVKAPYFDGADLLVAADCTAFACGDFAQRFMAGKVTIIGCPKLDGVDYSDKLAEILCNNDVNSITVARMEVPCCGGLQAAVERAALMASRRIPVTVVIIATDGHVVSVEEA